MAITLIGDSQAVGTVYWGSGMPAGSKKLSTSKGNIPSGYAFEKGKCSYITVSYKGKTIKKGCIGQDKEGNNVFCKEGATLQYFKDNEKNVSEIVAKTPKNQPIVFQMGGNDVGGNKSAEKLVDMYIEYFKQQMAKPEWQGKKIIFVGVPPRWGKKEDQNKKVNEFNELMKKRLPEIGISFIDLNKYTRENGLIPKDKNTDGVHYGVSAKNKMWIFMKKEIKAIVGENDYSDARDYLKNAGGVSNEDVDGYLKNLEKEGIDLFGSVDKKNTNIDIFAMYQKNNGRA